MTRNMIILEFVVPTVLAIALGTVLSICAVSLTDKYLGSDLPETLHPFASSR